MATLEKKITSININKKTSTQKHDELALDEPVCIFVNDEYHVTLVATPNQIQELATGYLLGENIITNADEITGINIRENNIYVTVENKVDLRNHSIGRMNLIVTACGANPQTQKNKTLIPKVDSPLKVNYNKIVEMMRELNKRCSVHLRTRGTHSAMACTKDSHVHAFAEDVGRHNAVDKVIGELAINESNPAECVLLSTGRQSGEMVLKAAQAGIPVVASMTVPLVSGVRLAEQAGITLISLSRGSLKVYTHPERIIDFS